MRTRPTLLATAAVVIALLAGCSSAPPSVAPSVPLGSPPPSPSARPPATPAQPSGQPVTPAPPGTTDNPGRPVGWDLAPVASDLAGTRFEAVVAIRGGFLAVGCVHGSGERAGFCAKPAAWLSPDAISWMPPMLLPLQPGETGGTAIAAIETRHGLVIGGIIQMGDRSRAAMWLSPDRATVGRAAAAGADDAAVVTVGALGDRLVAIGGAAFMEMVGFRGWWSDDGLTWNAATVADSSVPFPAGLLPGPDEGLIAWGFSCGVCPAVSAWWASPDGRAWTALGEPPGLEGSVVTAAMATEAGYLAAGTAGVLDERPAPGEWFRTWSDERWVSGRPPVLPDGATVQTLTQVGHGTVATAEGPGTTTPNSVYVLGRGPGDDGWRGLAELPGLVSGDLVQDPNDPARLVVVGHDGGVGTPALTWTGSVDWSP